MLTGHGDQQIVVDLRLVVGVDGLLVRLHALDVELGHDVDVLLLQDVAQTWAARGLVKARRQRRGKRQLHVVADALLVEVPVGQEEELQRARRGT